MDHADMCPCMGFPVLMLLLRVLMMLMTVNKAAFLLFANVEKLQRVWWAMVLFSVCGVCKLWRRVGHTLFFSNVWQHHSDVIVHPSQLFTLSPHPLRLHTSDHLLRCFVHRTPCPASGLSPRFGRLWRFAAYLGSDYRGLRCDLGQSPSGRGLSGGGGGGGGGLPAGATPQLLMLAQQTGRRSYELLLSPSTPGPSPCPSPGSWGPPAAAAFTSIGWRSPQPDGGGGACGGGGDLGDHGWRPTQRSGSSSYGFGKGSNCGGGGAGGGGGGRRGGSRDSGVVAVLRSNIRCSHYELVPEASCPWARRLIAVAGYIPGGQGGPPPPLIRLEYRLRVRGIMLPRRMKVEVPVPHSLQRVVHNPLYDTHEPVADGASLAAAGWPALGAAAAAAAVMAPPPPVPPGVAAAAGGGNVAAAQPPAGGLFGGAGLVVEGQEGLMDNLEDVLEAAMRTEPLLFANMVDAAVVRPEADDDEAAPAEAGGGGGGGVRAPNLAGAAAAGGRVLRRVGSAGSALLRGFLLNRLQAGGGAAGAAAGGGGVEGQPAGGGGGTVQWWGPGSPGSRRGGVEGADTGAAGVCGDDGGVGGWTVPSPSAAPARVVQLQNKAPHWNDALMCWCLNFRGRVKMASVKNFQLVCSADKAERCVMQFGKVEEGIYILDFNPCVLTAAQAFAAALSTFETKYLL
ncbi:hypothetical protein VOLCADRAFT_90606 [Volvox carteri f. nagariensis]|uniref:Tubby C-terminal domain-containing protein n=1 Tax=Volvox carteri f. nagariensis TaxID=3068 RepID=D8TUV2_VOLCA|nr:uncharacterized protein VOLCADRAFT_90606 [Volvox carteri f. nagariensis]EFJ48774.1 hypothetical protein VOLCADRAFT_90606 [Volvox carteri f. nagariensis]|eukprot:XP_002950106.1 hypothetical protein VOLCADRAFT_90606 [Volvox carteri f. nagariensis]